LHIGLPFHTLVHTAVTGFYRLHCCHVSLYYPTLCSTAFLRLHVLFWFWFPRLVPFAITFCLPVSHAYTVYGSATFTTHLRTTLFTLHTVCSFYTRIYRYWFRITTRLRSTLRCHHTDFTLRYTYVSPVFGLRLFIAGCVTRCCCSVVYVPRLPLRFVLVAVYVCVALVTFARSLPLVAHHVYVYTAVSFTTGRCRLVPFFPGFAAHGSVTVTVLTTTTFTVVVPITTVAHGSGCGSTHVADYVTFVLYVHLHVCCTLLVTLRSRFILRCRARYVTACGLRLRYIAFHSCRSYGLPRTTPYVLCVPLFVTVRRLRFTVAVTLHGWFCRLRTVTPFGFRCCRLYGYPVCISYTCRAFCTTHCVYMCSSGSRYTFGSAPHCLPVQLPVTRSAALRGSRLFYVPHGWFCRTVPYLVGYLWLRFDFTRLLTYVYTTPPTVRLVPFVYVRLRWCVRSGCTRLRFCTCLDSYVYGLVTVHRHGYPVPVYCCPPLLPHLHVPFSFGLRFTRVAVTFDLPACLTHHVCCWIRSFWIRCRLPVTARVAVLLRSRFTVTRILFTLRPRCRSVTRGSTFRCVSLRCCWVALVPRLPTTFWVYTRSHRLTTHLDLLVPLHHVYFTATLFTYHHRLLRVADSSVPHADFGLLVYVLLRLRLPLPQLPLRFPLHGCLVRLRRARLVPHTYSLPLPTGYYVPLVTRCLCYRLPHGYIATYLRLHLRDVTVYLPISHLPPRSVCHAVPHRAHVTRFGSYPFTLVATHFPVTCLRALRTLPRLFPDYIALFTFCGSYGIAFRGYYYAAWFTGWVTWLRFLCWLRLRFTFFVHGLRSFAGWLQPYRLHTFAATFISHTHSTALGWIPHHVHACHTVPHGLVYACTRARSRYTHGSTPPVAVTFVAHHARLLRFTGLHYTARWIYVYALPHACHFLPVAGLRILRSPLDRLLCAVYPGSGWLRLRLFPVGSLRFSYYVPFTFTVWITLRLRLRTCLPLRLGSTLVTPPHACGLHTALVGLRSYTLRLHRFAVTAPVTAPGSVCYG